MTARFAIYDPRTDNDIAEFFDLPEAYVEIDRLTQLHDRPYGVRIAQAHRTQANFAYESRRSESSLGRVILDE
jgi:hypothetical protein